jgi:hypothetical protein
MAPADFLSDRSIPECTPIPRSTPIDPILRNLFEYLSLGLTPGEILTALDKLRQSPREDLARLAGECHRHCWSFFEFTTSFANDATAISLSSSERSSLISNFSRLSSASSFSTYSQESVTSDGSHTHHEGSQGSRKVSGAQETVSSPSVMTHTAFICFACNTQCSTQSALKRHQEEKCVREADTTCPDCQWTGKRLIRHYSTLHRDKCPQCYSIPGERVCDRCKVRLSKSRVRLPQKKTWGCPYCTGYFQDFDLWNKHCMSHHQRGDIWSWHIMIWSLLHQFDLSRFGQYNWDECDWSRLDERTGPELRDDLQRLRVPKDVQRHQEYCELQIDEALIRYTHRFLTVRPPLSSFALAEPHQQASISHIPLPRTQGATYFSYQDMNFPVPPSSTNNQPDGSSDTRQGFRTQTLPFEMFYDSHGHQNSRPDSATIPHSVRLQYADHVHTPDGKPVPQFYCPTPIATPISGVEFRNTPNGQSVEPCRANEKYSAPNSNADALQMLCRRPPYTKTANFEAMSELQLHILPERYTSSGASRTVPGRRNAECETENEPATPPQARPMSDVIFQEYCFFPTSSPEPEL